MEEIIKIIANYGIALVIAGLYLYRNISVDKKMVDAISRLEIQEDDMVTLRKAIIDTAVTLALLQSVLSTHVSLMEKHDKRAEYMNGDLRSIAVNLGIKKEVK